MILTVEKVNERIEQIKAVLWDPEDCHQQEDMLHSDVLTWIAQGPCTLQEARDLARAALKTFEIEDFHRWYA